ncbi:putative transposable element [Trichonephila clavipes]|nr:putative transposable element [Trichonephila clavipes]
MSRSGGQSGVKSPVFSPQVIAQPVKWLATLPAGSGTLNIRQASSPFGRLVEGEERWETPGHPQGFSYYIWGGTEQNRTVTCMVFKAKANDRRKNLALSCDEFRSHRSDFIRQDGEELLAFVKENCATAKLKACLKKVNQRESDSSETRVSARKKEVSSGSLSPKLCPVCEHSSSWSVSLSVLPDKDFDFKPAGRVGVVVLPLAFCTQGCGCQVIYSQFGLAIHQNDHQARRRFVEWAQNEIVTVPDFHKRILFSNEAHFWLNGYVNKQNCRIWSEANPKVYVETPLHPEKLTVWCALWAGGFLLQNDEGHNVTANGDRYRAMITNFFIPELNNYDVQELWFQIRRRNMSHSSCHNRFIERHRLSALRLNGYVNKQNCRIWSEANPKVYVETPLHPEKLTVWCALWAGGIRLQNDEGHNVTVNGAGWFQQDGETCHTARATIDLLKDTFDDRLISRFGPVNWPPRSRDLTPLNYFLWGYVKSLVYADKPQTLDHLEDNILRVIADIRPQMLEKVIEN